jgi:hypothetical protein
MHHVMFSIWVVVMIRRFLLAACALVALVFAASVGASAQQSTSFDKFAGLWVGEGRLGTREGQTEAVKCRVTYRSEQQGMELKQSIRCASAGGSIEVRVAARLEGTAISGDWEETTRGWTGLLSGGTTPLGLKVSIKGENINANMDIIVKDALQVVEIQFIDGALLGLTLILKKQGA